MAQEISWCSGPRAPTGFYVDERIGLTVTPGCAWNDKTGSRWRVGMIEAPAPKSRLLAAAPSWHLTALVSGLVYSNAKPETTASDWGKTP